MESPGRLNRARGRTVCSRSLPLLASSALAATARRARDTIACRWCVASLGGNCSCTRRAGYLIRYHSKGSSMAVVKSANLVLRLLLELCALASLVYWGATTKLHLAGRILLAI